ncbi:hypothetical protein FQN54_009272 [Arachnomyces sp. PD_36]|nr:hypothetical protein FQN54_009272 [Arachnomyces sp. PD_36]
MVSARLVLLSRLSCGESPEYMILERKQISEHIRYDLLGERRVEEIGAVHLIELPTIAPGLVDHDRPLVGVLPGQDAPEQSLPIIRSRPGDDLAPLNLQFLRLLVEPEDLPVAFELLLLAVHQVEVLIPAIWQEDVRVILDASAAHPVHEFHVVAWKGYSQFQFDCCPVCRGRGFGGMEHLEEAGHGGVTHEDASLLPRAKQVCGRDRMEQSK